MSNSRDIEEQQTKIWNSAAPGWKRWDDFQNRQSEPVSEALLQAVHLKEGHEVLELACGTGEPGIPAAKRIGKGHVIGTDVAEDMMALASEKARAQGVANYSTKYASALSIPFPDGHFDAVLCRWGIMFFPDPPACLRETLRVMKPGTYAAFATWNDPARNPHLGIPLTVGVGRLGLKPPSSDNPGPFRYTDPNRLSREMTEAGFKDIQVHEATGTMDFDSPDQFWEFSTELNGLFRAAIQNAEPPLRDEVKASVLQQASAFSKGGRIQMAYSSWVVIGRKG